MIKEFNKIILIICSVTIVFFMIGCEKTNQKTSDQENQKNEEAQEEKVATSEPAEELPKIIIPDLKGSWSGVFDGRSTTLTITEQDSTTFKGNITINYRNPVNQRISGTINPEDNTISMKDLLKSRFQGNYSGKLSEDKNKFSGTFTMILDKSRYNFSLDRK
ncbi:MAG: hypothetical protein Q7S39_00190 [Ignavibacteria bacterium]|nr:hypothetical protein [Ignavibacteria bacterium]